MFWSNQLGLNIYQLISNDELTAADKKIRGKNKSPLGPGTGDESGSSTDDDLDLGDVPADVCQIPCPCLLQWLMPSWIEYPTMQPCSNNRPVSVSDFRMQVFAEALGVKHIRLALDGFAHEDGMMFSPNSGTCNTKRLWNAFPDEYMHHIFVDLEKFEVITKFVYWYEKFIIISGLSKFWRNTI